jgi:hypothetical protein
MAGESDGGGPPMPTGIVRKSNLVLAILSAPHEAAKRRQYAYVEKKARPCTVVAGSYVIQGDLQFRGSEYPIAVVNAELQNFFPITRAVVTHPFGQKAPLAAPVVLVNKQLLSALSIGDASFPAQMMGSDNRRQVPTETAPTHSGS